jgi:hypothetical protein
MNLVQLRPRLQMDVDLHQYYLDSHRIPGVNEVIDDMLRPASRKHSGVEIVFDPAKRDLGTYVHQLTALEDRGQLDVDSLDPTLAPWYGAWLRFKRDWSPEMLFIEYPVFNEKYRYAGTIDRVMKISWRGRPGAYLVDIKTGVGSVFSRLQTAAYREAFHLSREGETFLEATRFILRLRPDMDPPYEFIAQADLDLPYFHSAVQSWWWCYNNFNRKRSSIPDVTAGQSSAVE